MIYFIVNESSKSGKSKEIVNDVVGIFKKNSIEYKPAITKYEGHACEIAEKIVKKEYTDFLNNSDENFKTQIIVLGGDGTINEVVNGIMNAKNESEEIYKFSDEHLFLSVYPTGSGNDFIRGLHIKRDSEEFYKAVTDNREEFHNAVTENIEDYSKVVTDNSKNFKSVDIGKVTFSDGTSKYFAISTGMGMDALVCRKAETSSLKKVLNKIGLGKLTYIILTIQTIFSMDYSSCEIEYEEMNSNGELETKNTHLDKMIYIAALNLFAEGGGVPMAPNADPSDGLLDICSAHGMSRASGFLNLVSLSRGKHEGKKGFFTKKVKSITIKNDREMTVHTDGEDALVRDYMKIECVPGAINVV